MSLASDLFQIELTWEHDLVLPSLRLSHKCFLCFKKMGGILAGYAESVPDGKSSREEASPSESQLRETSEIEKTGINCSETEIGLIRG